MSTTDVTAPIDQRSGGTAGSSSRVGDTQEAVIARLSASLADALALAVSNERRSEQSESALADCRRTSDRLLSDQTDACRVLADELAAIKNSHGYRVLTRLWQFRLRLAPSGTRRDRLVRAFWHVCDSVFRWPPRLPSVRTRQAAMQSVGSLLVPVGSLRERCLRKASQKVRRTRCRIASEPGLNLEQVLRENEDRKGIVVYPPFIDWNWMRQRPHQLMAQFAAAGYLSLFCSPKVRSDWFRGFKRLDERLYLCDALAPLYDIPEPIVLTSWTEHWDTIKRFRSPLVIYDYLDDLSVASNTGMADDRKLDLHRKLATRSEIVLATARRLHDEMRQFRPDALYCPNGADYEHFHLTAAPPVPADMADVVESGRPIIGYYGALARWFDYALLERAAKARSEFEFVLIGPNLDRSLARQPLSRLPNVRWLGQKRYEELPAYLHYFTVATIPFVINDITKSTSPVKLFEYMAGGKPIVTTDMPECREYPCVIVARNATEYGDMLDEAVHRGQWESYRQLLDREARNNTWHARVRQILDEVDRIAVCKQTRSA
jgi:glycosyltransferase involved in cell wall biosynthesis